MSILRMQTLITFDRFPDDWNGGRTERVHLDPRLVTVVQMAERRTPGGACPVAIIVMVDGDEYVVYDPFRIVAPQIRAAQLDV